MDEKIPDYARLKKHIFICTNERPEGHPRGCCLAKGSKALVERFKRELKERGLKGEVRAQRAGCLDTCEVGPSVVIYPDNVWYCRVNEEDVEEIIESHVLEGKPVERLLTPGRN